MTKTTDQHTLFFGDIHNHNACGYGLGSMERTIDIARTHLDFFAFTGHSSWHDLQPMEGGREAHWHNGFARLREQWPRVQNLIASANRNGEFCAFLGFEWHSSRYGDQCIIFPRDHEPLVAPETVDELRSFAASRGAFMIPHHLAYPTGNRGVNWEIFQPEHTPVVEIYSEHGNAEDDRGLHGYFTHSMPGRVTGNTVRSALDRGLRFGFVASSDNHAGFPGAYGEGLMGVFSTDLSREALFEAIRARRTYALTGDRIEVFMTIDGMPMGAVLPPRTKAELDFTVVGKDALDVVEVIHNGEIVQRSFPQRVIPPGEMPVQLRLEWGWGPWGDLGLERIADWRFTVTVQEGRIHRFFPCLQSGPFDEHRRHRFSRKDDHIIAVESYTSRRGAYRQNPNQSMVLELEGNSATSLEVALLSPGKEVFRHWWKDLYHGSAVMPTGPFPRESMLWHRILPKYEHVVSDRVQLTPGNRPGYTYLRARQSNGHLAWSSPVFFDVDP